MKGTSKALQRVVKMVLHLVDEKATKMAEQKAV